MAATYSFYLLRDDACLGTLADCTFEFPRYFGRFEPTASFEQVRSVFESMADQLRQGRTDEYARELAESKRLNLFVQVIGDDSRTPVLVRLLIPNGPATFEADQHRLPS